MTVLYKKENNVSLKLQLYKLNIIVEIQRWFSGEGRRKKGQIVGEI